MSKQRRGWSDEEIADAAKVVHVRGRLRAPELLEAVRVLADQTGGTLYDERKCVKSEPSIRRKLGARHNRARARKFSAEQFGLLLEDVVRFTVVFEAETYWDDVRAFVSLIPREALDDSAVRNFWLNEKRRYSGVHLIPTAGGEPFEIQLHTFASRAWRMNSHPRYERLRVLKPGDPKADEINEELQDYCLRVIPKPPGDDAVGVPYPRLPG